jgi:hypothetical protein
VQTSEVKKQGGLFFHFRRHACVSRDSASRRSPPEAAAFAPTEHCPPTAEKVQVLGTHTYPPHVPLFDVDFILQKNIELAKGASAGIRRLPLW